MQAFAGWLSIFVGVMVLISSARVVIRANSGALVSYWSRPLTHQTIPTRSITLRALGAGITILGASFLGPTIGYWVVAVVVAAFIPGGLLVARHNNKLAASAQR